MLWLGRSILMTLTLMAMGCSPAPVSIVQSQTTEPKAIESTVVEKEPAFVERWTVVYERKGPEAPLQVTESNDSPTETVQQTPKQVKSGCPRFELPRVDSPPEIPELDRNRRDDYEYIAEELLNHVQDLMEYNLDVQSEYTRAYRDYVATCD